MTSLTSSQIQFPLPFSFPPSPCTLPCEALWKVKWMRSPVYVYFKALPSLSGFLSALEFCNTTFFFHHISPVRHFVGCLSSSWWQFSETGISDPVFPGVGFPWWLSGKESVCQCRKLSFGPWVRKISWRWIWQPAPIFLSWKSHAHRSLVGYSPCGCKRVGHNLAAKTTKS